MPATHARRRSRGRAVLGPTWGRCVRAVRRGPRPLLASSPPPEITRLNTSSTSDRATAAVAGRLAQVFARTPARRDPLSLGSKVPVADSLALQCRSHQFLQPRGSRFRMASTDCSMLTRCGSIWPRNLSWVGSNRDSICGERPLRRGRSEGTIELGTSACASDSWFCGSP